MRCELREQHTRRPLGSAAITAVIDDFVVRCAADGRINPKFARTEVPRLKAMLVEQVSAATVARSSTPGAAWAIPIEAWG